MSESKNIVEATDGNFDAEVLKANQVTLVDFWAEWCGPCRMLAPTIESIADQYTGKVKVCKMDVDNNPTVPTKFGVRGIPTVIVFKGGQEVDRLVGNQPKDSYVQAISKFV